MCCVRHTEPSWSSAVPGGGPLASCQIRPGCPWEFGWRLDPGLRRDDDGGAVLTGAIQVAGQGYSEL
jgi:hypothetical protein